METTVTMAESTSDALDRLHAVLDAIGPVAVAVSGGVDSMTLAAVAHRRAPTTTRLYHATSPAVPEAATARLRARAECDGWTLSVIDAGEFADPNYRANPVNRCFYCKDNLYQSIQDLAGETVVSGANLDDLGDYRPGLDAAAEHKVRHPLIEAEIGKADVRAIAAAFGLDDVAELPSAPCLSSRVETGIAIEADTLTAIDAAERWLRRRLRPETVRCRVRPSGVVIELDEGTLGGLAAPERAEIAAPVAAMFAVDQPAPSIDFAAYARGSAFIGDK
jgi:uncharacterized protein